MTFNTCQHEWHKDGDPDRLPICKHCKQTSLQAFCPPNGATVLAFMFPSTAHMKAFKQFMCGSGEQDFWGVLENDDLPWMGFDWHQGSFVPTRTK